MQTKADQFLIHSNCPSEYVNDDSSQLGSSLCINRMNGSVSFQTFQKSDSLRNHENMIPIGGVVGIVQLHSSRLYLLVVSDYEKVGCFTSANHSVFKVSKFEIFPLLNNNESDSDELTKRNNHLLSMINFILSTPNFYFSPSLNLSVNLLKVSEMESLNLLMNKDGGKSTSSQLDEKESLDSYASQFTWNLSMLKRLFGMMAKNVSLNKSTDAKNVASFCVGLIHGFLTIKQFSLSGKLFRLTLISRKSTRRTGSRLFCRGINVGGHVSNFVETEQIVEEQKGAVEGGKGLLTSSFIVLRGSIPLFWSQVPHNVFQYKPDGVISSVKSHETPFSMHLNFLKDVYGSVMCINLIDSKGWEGELERKFASLVIKETSSPNHTPSSLDYIAFDFHSKFKNSSFKLSKFVGKVMNFIKKVSNFVRKSVNIEKQRTSIRYDDENLALQTTSLQNKIYEYLSFECKTSSLGDKPFTSATTFQTMQYKTGKEVQVIEKQESVCRVNCVDNLDRTNVVQHAICSENLKSFLSKAKMTAQDPSTAHANTLHAPARSLLLTSVIDAEWYRDIWACNADILSMSYAGTRALKTDITRTGVRTWRGMLMDAGNSLLRFYKNNFQDGYKQDALDLFLGNHLPSNSPTSTTQRSSNFGDINDVDRFSGMNSFLVKPFDKITRWLSTFSPILLLTSYSITAYMSFSSVGSSNSVTANGDANHPSTSVLYSACLVCSTLLSLYFYRNATVNSIYIDRPRFNAVPDYRLERSSSNRVVARNQDDTTCSYLDRVIVI